MMSALLRLCITFCVLAPAPPALAHPHRVENEALYQSLLALRARGVVQGIMRDQQQESVFCFIEAD